jgi:hypothetical protein
MARMTGKDNNNSKDDNSKDNGNNGKDDNNDGGNNNSGGGGSGKIGGEVGGVARSVAWLVAVFFAIGCLVLTYRRNCTDTFGNKFILVNLREWDSLSARRDCLAVTRFSDAQVLQRSICFHSILFCLVNQTSWHS